MENSCFFLGHRSAPQELLPALEAAVERCDHLIAWVNRPGTARDLLDWARRRAERGLLHLENLAEG